MTDNWQLWIAAAAGLVSFLVSAASLYVSSLARNKAERQEDRVRDLDATIARLRYLADHPDETTEEDFVRYNLPRHAR